MTVATPLTVPAWFPRHMQEALSKIHAMAPHVHHVVELRDARCPRSSANPLLRALQQQEREKNKVLVVYGKKDLSTLRQGDVEHEGAMVIKTNYAPDLDRLMHRLTAELTLSCKNVRLIKVLVVGIPNVGKSSLINALRARGTGISSSKKAVSVGALPGVTRHTGQMVIIHDSGERQIALLDTPGVLQPSFADSDEEAVMRIALTGAIWDERVGKRRLVEFGLGEMQRVGLAKRVMSYAGLGLGDNGLPSHCPFSPLDNVDEYLRRLALHWSWFHGLNKREKANRKNQEITSLSDSYLDTHRAMVQFLKTLREGRFGKFNLDA